MRKFRNNYCELPYLLSFDTQAVNKQKFKKRKQQSFMCFVMININLTYEKY